MRRATAVVDGSVVRAIAHGDHDAFAVLLDEFGPHVLGIVSQVIDDPDRSAAVTRDVFLEVWRTAPRYHDTDQDVTSWVMTIALRRAFDRLRLGLTTALPDLPSGDLVDQSGAYALQMGRVEQALGDLTALQRQVISLSYFEFLSADEIADALNVSTATVATRTRDALLTLRLGIIERQRRG